MAIKRTCRGCKALTALGNCLLGYNNGIKDSTPIPSPKETCPKPKTIREYMVTPHKEEVLK